MRWWRSRAETDVRARLIYGTASGVMLGLGLTIVVAWAATGGYARPELLAEMDWLAQHLNDPGVRIVDMRPEEAYRQGHLPGAVHLERKALKDADNDVYVLPPDKLAPLMSGLGIGQNCPSPASATGEYGRNGGGVTGGRMAMTSKATCCRKEGR
jgi:hypothetical protein